MAEKGYSFLTPGQAAPTGMEVVTIIDSKGVSKQWYKNDKRHRENDQPAVISCDGEKQWWIDGKQIK